MRPVQKNQRLSSKSKVQLHDANFTEQNSAMNAFQKIYEQVLNLKEKELDVEITRYEAIVDSEQKQGRPNKLKYQNLQGAENKAKFIETLENSLIKVDNRVKLQYPLSIQELKLLLDEHKKIVLLFAEEHSGSALLNTKQQDQDFRSIILNLNSQIDTDYIGNEGKSTIKHGNPEVEGLIEEYSKLHSIPKEQIINVLPTANYLQQKLKLSDSKAVDVLGMDRSSLFIENTILMMLTSNGNHQDLVKEKIMDILINDDGKLNQNALILYHLKLRKLLSDFKLTNSANPMQHLDIATTKYDRTNTFLAFPVTKANAIPRETLKEINNEFLRNCQRRDEALIQDIPEYINENSYITLLRGHLHAAIIDPKQKNIKDKELGIVILLHKDAEQNFQRNQKMVQNIL